MKKHFNWICGFGLALAVSLHAQIDPGKPEGTGRRAWIVAANIPEDVPNPLPVLSGDKLLEVQLQLRSIGNPFPVDETGAVRAVKSETKPDGEVVYKDLARCVIPKGVREALIVLVPSDDGQKEEEGDGLKFKAKVIDLSKFKKGGCLYVNLTKAKLGIIIGDIETGVKTSVDPGGVEFINPLKHPNKKGVFPVQFLYEVPKKSKAEWKLMTSSRMAIFESRREICVFFYNKQIENIDFRGIPFITPPPKKIKRPQP